MQRAELVSFVRARGLAVVATTAPDGAAQAEDPEIVLVQVRPTWARLSDDRPGSSGSSLLDGADLRR